MKTNQSPSEGSSHVLLTGAILLANMDYVGLSDYVLKATAGAIIWVSFRLLGDYLTQKIKNKTK